MCSSDLQRAQATPQLSQLTVHVSAALCGGRLLGSASWPAQAQLPQVPPQQQGYKKTKKDGKSKAGQRNSRLKATTSSRSLHPIAIQQWVSVLPSHMICACGSPNRPMAVCAFTTTATGSPSSPSGRASVVPGGAGPAGGDPPPPLALAGGEWEGGASLPVADAVRPAPGPPTVVVAAAVAAAAVA